MSVSMQSISPEVVSTNDFQKTICPDVFMNAEGDVIFVTNPKSATLVRPERNPVMFKGESQK